MKKLSEIVDLYGRATEIYNNIHEVNQLEDVMIDKGTYLRLVTDILDDIVYFETDTSPQEVFNKMQKGFRKVGLLHINTIPLSDSGFAWKRNRAIPFSSYRQNV